MPTERNFPAGNQPEIDSVGAIEKPKEKFLCGCGRATAAATLSTQIFSLVCSFLDSSFLTS